MFLLQCPGCKNRMQYQPLKNTISDAKKRCVYCGRSFKVRENIVKVVKS